MSDRLLIVDFGSQVTQLIARRVREAGVYCEIHPFQSVDQAKIEQFGPKAIVLSGGPASVIEGAAPAANPAIFTAKVPVLGICYGEQTMAQQLGGAVEAGHHREFGRAELLVKSPSALFDGVWQPGDKKQVWMSHGDRVTRLPPGFSVITTSENAPFAAISDEARKYYGVQFHPEVMHTPDGAKLLRNFALKIAGFKGDWTMHAFKERAIAQIRAQVSKVLDDRKVGDVVYFLSDRNGAYTLYAYDTKAKSVKQVLQNEGLDIKSASAGPGGIVYDQFGEPVYFTRMDGQGKANVDTSFMKARTALNVRAPSKTVMNQVLQGRAGGQREHDCRVLEHDGDFVGAVR